MSDEKLQIYIFIHSTARSVTVTGRGKHNAIMSFLRASVRLTLMLPR